MEKRLIITSLLLISLTFSIIGFSIHCCLPSEFVSRHFPVQSGEYYVEHFEIKKFFRSSYQMTIDIELIRTSEENCSVLLLDEINYLKFSEEATPLEELTSLLEMSNILDASFPGVRYRGDLIFTEDEEVNFYLVVFTEKIEYGGWFSPAAGRGFFYLAITPPPYYIGLLVAFISIMFFMAILIYCLSDWKKYLVLGITANLMMFLLRIPTLRVFSDLTSSLFYTIQASPLQDIISLEMYLDYKCWYMSWIDPFLEGSLLYSGDLAFHQFPPLFIISLGLFALLPIPGWKMAIPIFLSHIATGYLVFLISLKLSNQENIATRAMLIYYLNPISLIYASFCWLNPSIFVFFIILAFYLIIIKKEDIKILRWKFSSYDLALAALGISTMYKQFAAIFFPVMIIAILKQRGIGGFDKNLKEIMRYMLIYSGVIFLVLLPVLTLNFNGFLESQIAGIEFGVEHIKLFYYAFPVNFATVFVVFGFPDVFITLLAYLLIYYVLLGGSGIVIYLVYWIETRKQNQMQPLIKSKFIIKNGLFWSLMLVFCLHLFYPRGSYKYYLILLVPFISMISDFKEYFAIETSQNRINTEAKDKLLSMNFVLPIGILLFIVLCSRYVYFLFLLVWQSYFLIQKRTSGKIGEKIRFYISNNRFFEII